jgi:hypothetical protein
VVPGESPVTGFLRLDPHESKTDAPPSFYWTGFWVIKGRHSPPSISGATALRPGMLANALKATASGLLARFLMR